MYRDFESIVMPDGRVTQESIGPRQSAHPEPVGAHLKVVRPIAPAGIRNYAGDASGGGGADNYGQPESPAVLYVFCLRRFFLRRFLFLHHRRRKRGGRGFFRVARQAQRAQPHGLGAVGGSGVLVVEHRALAILGLPQLPELAVGGGLIGIVCQCNLHW